MLKELILKNRTYRRFYQEEKVSKETLKEVIELARLTSYGGNRQALRYVLSAEEKVNGLIFKNLKWAEYLSDWSGPQEGEKPSAYIVMLLDKRITKNCLWNHGLAAQSILLGLTEKGLGACQFNNILRAPLATCLNLPDDYEILMVIALGKPKESVIIDDMDDNGDVKYWRDGQGVHHVPKRKLDDLIIEI